ncbi:MAG: tetratricopeptide repeat protein [Candidatus Marinimicrobia bacterium]|nr:tetratricopeptide repeat protein [Candidatus Neomarinimicrobiota bacterium]
MSALEIVLSGVVGVLLIFLLFIILGKEKKVKDKTVRSYAEGLNYIINGDYSKAIRKLKFVVARDTDNIDAYIKLGLAYRRRGNPKNALVIHRNLLYRENLSKEQRLEIFRNLVEDFEDLNDNQSAVEWCERIIEIDKKNRWAANKLWTLYPAVGEWDKAIELLKSSPQKDKGRVKRRSAIYKMAEGLKLLEDGKYHESRLVFKKAIKYDASCEAPYFYIAESYFKEGRIQDALVWWERYLGISPDKSSFLLRKLEKALFELGNFDKVGDLYERLIEKIPDDIRIVISLALFYEKKGKIDEAIEVIDKYQEKYSGDSVALITRARLLVAKGELQEAERLLDDVLEKSRVKEFFVCKNCGYKSEEVRWICPDCKEIDTFF